VIRAVYSAGLAVWLAGYLPVYLARRRRQGALAGLAQRLGRFEPGLPPEPRCWVHAVSVGEAVAAAPLVEAIRARWPRLAVVMTTVTPTGARVVRDRLAGRAAHRYFPVDLPGAVRRALDAVRPRFFIGLETELWPNFYAALGTRRIPAMVANGRISDRSYRGYRRVRFAIAPALVRVTAFGMQTRLDADRIVALGAPADRVVVTGPLKADAEPPADEASAGWSETLGLAPDQPVWVAGSTHRGEDDAVLQAFRAAAARVKGLRLVLAPRHPERVPEVERLLAQHGLPALRRSTLPSALGDRPGAGAGRGALSSEPPVVVVDTVGELASIYGAADVVFVGGSLVPAGGHNMLEPALRRKPVLFGPHVENFRDSADLLVEAGGAMMVADADDLGQRLAELLASPDRRRAMGEAAAEAVSRRRGALRETMALVEKLARDAGGLT
jgi:3-deoxy-D-manno-octulosonic-acid transferase